MAGDVQSLAMRKAAHLLGGNAALAKYLDADVKDVEKWSAGEAEVPRRMLLQAVDAILDHLPPSGSQF